MQSVVPPELEGWFAGRGWRVRRHQIDMLGASDADRHALLVADTGAGKTLAGFLPTLADFTPSRLDGGKPPEGLHTLYVSPLKALAHDVQRNLLTRRYAFGPQEAPADTTTACPADDTGKPVSAAFLSRQL